METTGKERDIDGVRHRQCSRCKAWKTLDGFYLVKGVPHWRCSACQLAVDREYVQRNPERRRQVARRSRFNQTLKYYGLTREQYDVIALEAEGRCAICNEPSERLELDHCHARGQVRGLLCGPCNKALGLLGDDVERLRAAIAYLEPDVVRYVPEMETTLLPSRP